MNMKVDHKLSEEMYNDFSRNRTDFAVVDYCGIIPSDDYKDVRHAWTDSIPIDKERRVRSQSVQAMMRRTQLVVSALIAGLKSIDLDDLEFDSIPSVVNRVVVNPKTQPSASKLWGSLKICVDDSVSVSTVRGDVCAKADWIIPDGVAIFLHRPDALDAHSGPQDDATVQLHIYKHNDLVVETDDVRVGVLDCSWVILANPQSGLVVTGIPIE